MSINKHISNCIYIGHMIKPLYIVYIVYYIGGLCIVIWIHTGRERYPDKFYVSIYIYITYILCNIQYMCVCVCGIRYATHRVLYMYFTHEKI